MSVSGIIGFTSGLIICVLSVVCETQIFVHFVPSAMEYYDTIIKTHFKEYLSFVTQSTSPCHIFQKLTLGCHSTLQLDFTNYKVLGIYSLFWYSISILSTSIVNLIPKLTSQKGMCLPYRTHGNE